MKPGALQNSKRFILALGLIAGLLISIPTPEAVAVNDVQSSCVIGSSSSCPAQSPQEIYNLYGTTANGTYWLNVNGTPTQTYLILDTVYPDGGMWFLGMKGTKSSSNFNYSSTNWTSQSTTLNTNSLSDDVATDAKFNAYNYLPITKVVGVFKDRDSYAFNASGSGVYGTNSFGGHTWKEDISSQSMFSRFTTTGILYSQTSTMTRYDLYRETNASNGKLVFAYQTGYAKYGFAYSFGSATYRWGIAFNNENDDPRIDSSDAQAGIGLTSYGAASVFSYTDSLSYSINGGTGQLNGSTATYPSGFQIWGKMAAPSMAAPTSLTRTTVGNGSVQLNIGAASGAGEYAVQYKLSSNAWSSATTVRLTNPSSTPTATLTGLASGTYDFRVWARGTNNSSNTAVSLSSQVVDSTAPVITDTTYSTSAGSDSVYGKGDSFTVRMTFSETVTVTGSPQIPIQGLTSKFFTYYSGSGTKVIDFNYVIADGDLDSDGVAITSNTLALNGGSIKDLALNDASLNHIGMSAASTFAVDGVTPTVSSVATSASGQTLVITLSETQSTNALTSSLFVITVGGLRDTVTAVTQSGPRITLTLTFAVISSDSVLITYTDPTSANDTYSLQDVAGNDVATFSLSVTNDSTATTNTTATISLNPASSTAVFRTSTSIRVSTNTAGRVDFYQSGKIIPNCRNIATSSNIASCSWKPMVQSYTYLTARFRPTGAGFQISQSEPLRIYVTKRNGLR
jgi:Putative flagellar system-associated repeat